MPQSTTKPNTSTHKTYSKTTPSPSFHAKARRVTYAGPDLHAVSTHGLQQSRIHKCSPTSLHQRQKARDSLADDFAASLETHRGTIYTETTDALSTTVTDITAALDTLTTTFTTQLSLLQTQRNLALGTPLSAEELQISLTLTSPDGSRSKGVEVFTLEQRMQLFEDRVKEKEARLTELWAEWEAVQEELIVLAVEILGGSSVEVSIPATSQETEGANTSGMNNEAHQRLLASVVEAERKHVEGREQHQSVMNGLAEYEAEVKMIVGNAGETVREMQKEISLVKQRKIKALQRALEDLTGDE